MHASLYYEYGMMLCINKMVSKKSDLDLELSCGISSCYLMFVGNVNRERKSVQALCNLMFVGNVKRERKSVQALCNLQACAQRTENAFSGSGLSLSSM